MATSTIVNKTNNTHLLRDTYDSSSSSTAIESSTANRAIVLYPNDGYAFDGTEKMYLTFNTSTTKNWMTYNETGGYWYNIMAYMNWNGATAYLNGSDPKASETSYTVTKSLTNCTSDIPDSVTASTTGTWTITANSGYTFEETPYLQYEDTMGDNTKKYFTVSTDKGTATLDFSLPTDFDNSLQIYATAAQSQETSYKVTKSLTNCTSDIPDSVTASTTGTWTITANSGYTFEETPYLQYEDTMGDNTKKYFTVSTDKGTATLDFSLPTDFDNTLIVYAYAQGETPHYSGKYGSVNVYKVDIDILDSFAQQRFVKDETVTSIDYVDLGNYVNKLHRVYVNIGECVTTTLQVGNYTTSITAETPLNDSVTLDFGEIDVIAHNGTNIDYNSEIDMFLPFVGVISLPTNKVMGKKISLRYTVNIVTGDAMAFVSVGSIDFAQYACKCSSDVYYLTHNNTGYSQNEFNSEYLRGFIPYILQTYYTDANKAVYNNAESYGTIGEFSGFNAFDNVTELSGGTMTTEERELIISALANGIIL